MAVGTLPVLVLVAALASSAHSVSHWRAGQFNQECSATCGDNGVYTRTVRCADSTGRTIPDAQCSSPDKPSQTAPCGRVPCGSELGQTTPAPIPCTGSCTTAPSTTEPPIGSQWRLSNTYSPCSVTCGGGNRTRAVRCADRLGETIDDSFCAGTEKPVYLEPCAEASCMPFMVNLTDWSPCRRCVHTRYMECRQTDIEGHTRTLGMEHCGRNGSLEQRFCARRRCRAMWVPGQADCCNEFLLARPHRCMEFGVPISDSVCEFHGIPLPIPRACTTTVVCTDPPPTQSPTPVTADVGAALPGPGQGVYPGPHGASTQTPSSDGPAAGDPSAPAQPAHLPFPGPYPMPTYSPQQRPVSGPTYQPPFAGAYPTAPGPGHGFPGEQQATAYPGQTAPPAHGTATGDGTQETPVTPTSPGQPMPTQYPGQVLPQPTLYPGQPMPGQPMPGQPTLYPGQPLPGQPTLYPGQPMPGQPTLYPGQPMPGQPMPGQPMPGQPTLYPGQPMPGQPTLYPGQPQPGQPMPEQPTLYPGQPMPGQPTLYPGQPVPGQPTLYPGQPMPGQPTLYPGQPMLPGYPQLPGDQQQPWPPVQPGDHIAPNPGGTTKYPVPDHPTADSTHPTPGYHTNMLPPVTPKYPGFPAPYPAYPGAALPVFPTPDQQQPGKQPAGGVPPNPGVNYPQYLQPGTPQQGSDTVKQFFPDLYPTAFPAGGEAAATESKTSTTDSSKGKVADKNSTASKQNSTVLIGGGGGLYGDTPHNETKKTDTSACAPAYQASVLMVVSLSALVVVAETLVSTLVLFRVC
ncbi:mucin-1-like isoform X2 [Sycon ciliatum]|uniref:mucin-1-like isoform X2 n=1 Tax=Sycon ciliatum TaxID=27933 RepID=UPI0031F64306